MIHILEFGRENKFIMILTNYANMILFSDGEAAPQVTCEALLSGIGLVVSKEASANLDASLTIYRCC